MKNQDTYLEINRLETNPKLAGLLPRELAFHYHALPVAEDGERITVAMAEPNDKAAREAIMGVLGSSACVVRADAQIIDGILAEFWKKASNPSLELLYCVPTRAFADQVEAYASNLADLLGAHISQFETSKTGHEAYRALTAEIEHIKADIVVLGEFEQSFLKELIEGPPENKLADQLPTLLLVVRQPRWPLKNILLIIRNDGIDETALDWAVWLARPSGAAVTILPLTIPVPTKYDQDPRLSFSIDTLLTSDSKLGKKLRSVAQRLVNSEIKGTLRLRQESPTWQIRFELLENDYDLVVIDCEPSNRLWHWILDELVNPLLSWTDRPVLFT
jgi:nucleotide-binding universal stress UspA family protein